VIAFCFLLLNGGGQIKKDFGREFMRMIANNIRKFVCP